jgi:cytochrome c peroxidase
MAKIGEGDMANWGKGHFVFGSSPRQRILKNIKSGRALVLVGLGIVLWLMTLSITRPALSQGVVLESPQIFDDPTGKVSTISTTGSFDFSNPFFQSLGTNGRTCATCHNIAEDWNFTPADAQGRFAATNGTDPLFRPVDGSNCPNSPGVNNTPPAESAYSLLLSKGLIRIALPVPSNAQFTVKVVSDPYGCALTTDSSGNQNLSMYRRPLPATNLGFLSAVMFDGRETVAPLNNDSTFQANLNTDLAHQAMDATLGHAQALSSPSSTVLQQIVAFELATFTAQQVDNLAGSLSAQGATGGPSALSTQAYYPGINDSLGGNPSGAAFDPNVFTLFTAWGNLTANDPYVAARESIARGEALFNSAPLIITNVKGLNDTLGLPAISGTCGTCHDTPDVGDHSFPVPLDIGISDVPTSTKDPLAAALAQLNSPEVPVYALRCSTALGAPSNVTIETTDPGRAMISGRCADIGKFKGPILRAVPAHAPYFQNGGADTLQQVVSFYNVRFQMNLSPNEMADLVNFLNSL